jgi:3-demethoxyubiquinol 3-hydroxylase
MSTPLQPPAPVPTADEALTVFYDGGCPLCRREIGLYQGLCATEAVRWHDVHAQAPDPAVLSSAQAMARFHVRDAQGQLFSGAAAFVVLWRALPGWRWLARVAALPGALPLMEWSYRGFLRVRPTMQRAARAMERRRP